MIDDERTIGGVRLLYFKTAQEALDYVIQRVGRDELYHRLNLAILTGIISMN